MIYEISTAIQIPQPLAFIFWRPSWMPSWISQPAPTMDAVPWQIHKLQGMTKILVYNIQCSTLVTTYSMK